MLHMNKYCTVILDKNLPCNSTTSAKTVVFAFSYNLFWQQFRGKNETKNNQKYFPDTKHKLKQSQALFKVYFKYWKG